MEQSKLINLIAFYLPKTSNCTKQSTEANLIILTFFVTLSIRIHIFFCTPNTIKQKCSNTRYAHIHILYTNTFVELMENLFVISFKPTQKVSFLRILLVSYTLSS